MLLRKGHKMMFRSRTTNNR